MTAEVAEQKLCAKCGQKSATSQTWCKDCRAKYQREWRDREAEMIGARNWQAGANALRKAMTAQLLRAPGALFSAASVVEWIQGFAVPEFPKSVEQPVKE